jgi:chemotaxis protein MotB
MAIKKHKFADKKHDDGEFLWLMSLSDLMILLFIFFVVMFSFSYKRMTKQDVEEITALLRNEKPPERPLDVIAQKFAKWVQDHKLQNQVTVTNAGDVVKVQIKDRLLFQSGGFEPTPEGVRLMQVMKDILEKIPNPYRIGIEGHTDDSPIHTKMIQDNWDLSGKRALAILYTLGLSEKALQKIQLISRGEMEPIVPNRDKQGNVIPENQAKNRRVTLKIF